MSAQDPAQDLTISAGLETVWRPGRPVDLRATLGPFVHGRFDPTVRVTGGTWWRAVRTPLGPGSQRIEVRPASDEVHCGAWGPGAPWLLETLPGLLGSGDVTAADFRPQHPLLAGVWRAHPGWRVPRSCRVFEALAVAVVEQKVTGAEAWRSWSRLLDRFGEPAPGPLPAGMRVPPSPTSWAAIPSWEWHRAGVGPERSATLVRAGRRGEGLERTLGCAFDEAERRLTALPGVGVWTAAEVRQRAHGDPDAVSVGDFHLGGQVVYALTGETDGDDDRMLELLGDYAGHRYRVVRMIELAGVTRPRRGPRYSPLDHRGR